MYNVFLSHFIYFLILKLIRLMQCLDEVIGEFVDDEGMSLEAASQVPDKNSSNMIDFDVI